MTKQVFLSCLNIVQTQRIAQKLDTHGSSVIRFFYIFTEKKQMLKVNRTLLQKSVLRMEFSINLKSLLVSFESIR